MPLTPSPRLGLTRMAGSDPFLRQTLVDNYDVLDAYPGYYPCTSTSRPSWGAAQAGMMIVETDTGRLLRWSGTAWVIFNNYTQSFRGGQTMNSSLAKGASPSPYLLVTIPSQPRSFVANVIITARVIKAAATPQSLTLAPWIDGSDCGFSYDEQIGFPDGPSGTTRSSTQISTVMGARTLTAGASHTVQLKATVGNTDNNTITLYGAKALVICSEQ